MNLASIITGRVAKPFRMVVYGVDGIGKTTFAAQAPQPVFIAAEDGIGLLDVPRFPAPQDWSQIFAAITALYQEQHAFQTVVLDSADWAEALCMAAVCRDAAVQYIDQVGYGKGYKMARDKFAELFRALDALWQKGMNVIVIAHSQIKRFDDPEHEPYDRHQIKLEEANAARLREWADMVLFANYDTAIREIGEGLAKTKRAVSFGKRMLFSQRSAAFDAKTRYPLPERMPIDWPQFWAAYQANYSQPALSQSAPAPAPAPAAQPTAQTQDEPTETN